jgi:enamine deaminase RidA (YjgF/YER057c/UK114 family)
MTIELISELTRETTREWQSVRLRRGSIEEYFLTVPAVKGCRPDELLRRLDRGLAGQCGAQVIRQSDFGLVNAGVPRGHGGEWPVTQVAEVSGNGRLAAGINVYSVAGVELRRLQRNGRTIGAVFEDEFARYCWLADVRPDDISLPRDVQARQVFEMLDGLLGDAGMVFTDIVRTWFYNERILDWYGEFNRVRTDFFKEKKVFDNLVPASTGVGGRNGGGAALVADAWAVKPKDSRLRIEAVPSPLQCPAPAYGSSFSRAVEVAWPDHRRVVISGTASIEPGGATAYVGDMDAQVELTMEVVEAILCSRCMGWSDVVRGVAYFKDGGTLSSYDNYCQKKGLPAFPAAFVQGDICRDDLLFELEVDAIQRS